MSCSNVAHISNAALPLTGSDFFYMQAFSGSLLAPPLIRDFSILWPGFAKSPQLLSGSWNWDFEARAELLVSVILAGLNVLL